MLTVNGKEYPLWSQFVEQQEKWIGGTLEDFGDSMDARIFGNHVHRTTITGISLGPNGDDSAFFSVNGVDFGCGFDTQTGGIVAGDEGWLTFRGYGGHKWRIQQSHPG